MRSFFAPSESRWNVDSRLLEMPLISFRVSFRGRPPTFTCPVPGIRDDIQEQYKSVHHFLQLSFVVLEHPVPPTQLSSTYTFHSKPLPTFLISFTPAFLLRMLFKSSILAAAVACLSVISVAEAHVGIQRPCPRGSNDYKNCKLNGGQSAVDWDTPSPIANSMKGYLDGMKGGLCKHTNKKTFVTKRTTITAGKTLTTQYEINDPHNGKGGGHCQWALSYDGGKTFAVIHDKLNNCFKGAKKLSTYKISFKVPSNVPKGNAIFLWVFYNEIGNRELYTSCSDVTVSSSSKKYTSVAPFIANRSKSTELKDGKNLYAKAVLDKFKQRKKVTIKSP